MYHQVGMAPCKSVYSYSNIDEVIYLPAFQVLQGSNDAIRQEQQ